MDWRPSLHLDLGNRRARRATLVFGLRLNIPREHARTERMIANVRGTEKEGTFDYPSLNHGGRQAHCKALVDAAWVAQLSQTHVHFLTGVTPCSRSRLPYHYQSTAVPPRSTTNWRLSGHLNHGHLDLARSETRIRCWTEVRPYGTHIITQFKEFFNGK